MITGLFVVFTPVCNRILFGVRTRSVFWFAVGASMVGMVLLTGGGSLQAPSFGDVLTLGAAACLGLHIALPDRFAHRFDAAALALGHFLAAELVFVCLWSTTETLVMPPATVWFALVVTGVVATALGFFVQTFVQQRISAVRTAVVLTMEPVFAAIFGVLLAGDRFTLLQAGGGALIIVALLIAELYPATKADLHALAVDGEVAS